MLMEEKVFDFAEFEKKYLEPFRELHYVFWPEKGFIVWRLATGENVELLHLRSFKFGRGYAKELIAEMVKQLEKNPPYYSVFGFSLNNRPELKEIYKRLGFNTTEDIEPPYKGSRSVIFWQDFQTLKDKYSEK